jgi:FG-GAP repeat
MRTTRILTICLGLLATGLFLHSAAAAAAAPGTPVLLAELTASDGVSLDNLGDSVAVSGDTIVAGAPYHTVTQHFQGAAYVYVKPSGGWSNMTQVAELTASDAAADDLFGWSVAISGKTIVVGAPQNLGGGCLQGKAYVFVKPATGWTNMTQTAILTPSDGVLCGQFGISVAVSGDKVGVGAPENTAGGVNNGAAYVYVKPRNGWANTTETAKLTSSDTAVGNFFGTSVSLSGTTFVAGSYNDNFGRGAAYIFVEPAGGWTNTTETAKLTASDGQANDHFGSSVAISGNTLVAGSGHQVHSFVGTVYVFVEPAGGWTNITQTAELYAQQIAVAIDGGTVLAGDPNINSNHAGLVDVFVKPSGGWKTTPKYSALLKGPTTPGEDLFGFGVGVSGTTMAIGAPDQTPVHMQYQQGAVWVYGP